nr:hypothetical protein [Tanacetum cinerariifolium]
MQGEQVQLVIGELRIELGILIQVKQGRLNAATVMENRVALDEEQLLFIAGGQDNDDECDAFDSDVDEAPTTQTMFMENLSSADLVYDETDPSYYLYILSETTALLIENKNLQSHINEQMKCVTKDYVTSNVLAPGMYAIDVAPLPPHCRNNREVHLHYLKHLRESVATLREIIEEARAEQCPLTRLTKLKVVHAKKTENVSTIRFGNDHFGAIMGYEDYVIGDNMIFRVYYVEGHGHNLFSFRQFYDFDIEVAFTKHSCYVRDTDDVELIKGYYGSNLYTLSVKDMMKSFPICLLSKASNNKSWLWHHRLNHLNFGKSKKHTHKPKAENTNLEVLNTLHMDFCGPMRVQTINGKKYILDIVDEYSSIFHQKSVLRTPQQNGVVKRRNRTLAEGASTMLIFSKALIFLWAEAVASVCYTQNRSLIYTRHNKTPYELVHDKKHDLTFLHVFGALCFPTNDSEDLGKLHHES